LALSDPLRTFHPTHQLPSPTSVAGVPAPARTSPSSVFAVRAPAIHHGRPVRHSHNESTTPRSRPNPPRSSLPLAHGAARLTAPRHPGTLRPAKGLGFV